jgi:hypothetical protein
MQEKGPCMQNVGSAIMGPKTGLMLHVQGGDGDKHVSGLRTIVDTIAPNAWLTIHVPLVDLHASPFSCYNAWLTIYVPLVDLHASPFSCYNAWLTIHVPSVDLHAFPSS